MSLAEPVPRREGRPADRRLVGAEPMLLSLLLASFVLFGALAAWTGQAVAWPEMGRALGPPVALIALGLHVRVAKRMERLPALLVGLGFYVAFGEVTNCLIYLRFPLAGPTLDPVLARADAALGYDWAAGVAWLAAHPRLSAGLAVVYESAVWQLAALLVLLALSGRVRDLHWLILTGALSVLLTVTIWWLAPTLGPATLVAVPAEVERAAGLVTGRAYADELLRLAADGNAVLSPHATIGTVAFPSYHLVMAALVARFAWGTPAFWAALALSLAMVPATMLQGGHHAVDLLGGAVVFAAAHWAADRLLPPRDPLAPSQALRSGTGGRPSGRAGR